ncbi:MAG: glycerol-3-phosphate 1-O-acyltransferase PlsY [Gemmatimonadota bacterium]|nr:glycerol-3-phosphate 1-O-acyltransferase PlsY [Gemmatimonadota bacterium]
MIPWLLCLAAYGLGATPTSFWVGKARGVDLRNEGSGNLGATNAFRVLGWQAALVVMVVDVLKGWFPVWYFPRLDGGAAWGWTLAYGAAAIVGHVFSFWVRFRGGKGVATSGGVFIALAPLAALGGFVVWLGMVALTRIVSVGSIAAALALPVLVAVTVPTAGTGLVAFTVGLSAFVIWKHRSNLTRLFRGEEPRIGQKRPAARAAS